MGDLRGRTVVVTGASGGLGRAAAIEFARRGCTVVLGARRAEALQETARRCRRAGSGALCVVTDVTREADVRPWRAPGGRPRCLLPRSVERLILHVLGTWHFDEAPQPRTVGNLWTPREREAHVHGQRPPRIGTPALVAWVATHPGRILAGPARRPA